MRFEVRKKTLTRHLLSQIIIDLFTITACFAFVLINYISNQQNAIFLA